MEITQDSLVVASGSQVSTQLGEETVILNFAKGAYFGLNEVGSAIWQQVQRPQTVSAIRDAIVATYEVDRAQCEQDVIRLLQQLGEQGLVELREPGA